MSVFDVLKHKLVLYIHTIRRKFELKWRLDLATAALHLTSLLYGFSWHDEYSILLIGVLFLFYLFILFIWAYDELSYIPF
jgi:hypothetical protein